MKEFRIIKQIGDSKPYSFKTFSTFEECYIELLRLISLQEENVKKEYYVLNDFYNNQHPPFLKNIVKFKIEEREVNEWKTYTKKELKGNKIIDLRERFINGK